MRYRIIRLILVQSAKNKKFVQNVNQEYTYKSVVMYTAFYYIRHYNGVLWQLYWPLNFFLHSIIFFPPHKVHVRHILSLRVKFHSSFKQVFPGRTLYTYTHTHRCLSPLRVLIPCDISTHKIYTYYICCFWCYDVILYFLFSHRRCLIQFTLNISPLSDHVTSLHNKVTLCAVHANTM